MIDEAVHAGTKAVLTSKREGCNKADFSRRDTWKPLPWRKQIRKHMNEGLMEVCRSFSKELFSEGELVDFLFVEGRNAVHVCAVPSLVATAWLEIAKTIAGRLPDLHGES